MTIQQQGFVYGVKLLMLTMVFKSVLKTSLYLLSVLFLLLLAWAFQSRSMPALQLWHTISFENEFVASDVGSGYVLADYLAQEQLLFDELQAKIYGKVEVDGSLFYSRYNKQGSQNPVWGNQNWNRSFELVPAQIKGGVLLLHGLTDSPYSLRLIGEILYAKGFYVLGLRLPGHGTIPAALTNVNWQDWRAASRLGARHVRNKIGSELPFIMAGYSNGGGLSVMYALDALLDDSLPPPEQLLLFSPEIGIDPVARIANSHKLLSFLPYFAQFKWLSIQPEYDPFKYNSFPKNAAQEAWKVTEVIEKRIRQVREAGRLQDFPGILTFLSWTDATVETSATIQRLYGQLDNLDSELIIFDINRLNELAPFIPAANASPLLRLKADAELPYRLTVITNRAGNSRLVTQQTKAPHSADVISTPLDMSWPKGIYSLSHVAIPFSPEDPVYGTADVVSIIYKGLRLGAMQPRGETHLLIAPLSQFMRLRHNPFFRYIEQRIVSEVDE
jgi:alpha-beta hydrolase superfamily lysophospholipase